MIELSTKSIGSPSSHCVEFETDFSEKNYRPYASQTTLNTNQPFGYIGIETLKWARHHNTQFFVLKKLVQEMLCFNFP